jgi:hypothetical protein
MSKSHGFEERNLNIWFWREMVKKTMLTMMAALLVVGTAADAASYREVYDFDDILAAMHIAPLGQVRLLTTLLRFLMDQTHITYYPMVVYRF